MLCFRFLKKGMRANLRLLSFLFLSFIENLGLQFLHCVNRAAHCRCRNVQLRFFFLVQVYFKYLFNTVLAQDDWNAQVEVVQSVFSLQVSADWEDAF